jgi:hypothetical protein
MGINADGDNVLLGRGKIFFNRNDDSGDPTGLRFMGNCTLFEITTSDENKDIFSSAEASAPLLKRVNIRRTVELSIEFDEYTKENMALALMGDEDTQSSPSSTPVSGESHVVNTGRAYQLGTDTEPARDVTSVTISGLTEDVDYKVIADAGLIYIMTSAEGGSVTDGDTISVDYTPSGSTYQTVKGGTAAKIEGALRFLGDPATGQKWDVQVWDVQITPDSALGLISDDFASSKLKATVQADAVNHPGESLYRATKMVA